MSAIRTRQTAELVGFGTEATGPLDALYYPRTLDRGRHVGLVHLHGKGANMYAVQGRFLPPMLPSVTHLALNMRCRDLAHNTAAFDYDADDGAHLGDIPLQGGMYESLEQGHEDIAAAVALLHEQGVDDVVVCGHSSGGWYTADYGARHDDIAARIFLSPLTDNKFALGQWFSEPSIRDATVAKARQLVNTGRGRELINVDAWYWAISAAALIERASEEDGTWLRNVQANPTPLLLLWGGIESRDALWRELFAQFAMETKTAVAIDGANHSFTDHEEEVGRHIRDFLASALDIEVDFASGR